MLDEAGDNHVHQGDRQRRKYPWWTWTTAPRELQIINVYVPQLQRELGLIGYLHDRLGCTVNSTAPLSQVSDAFVTAIGRYGREHQIPVVHFAKGQRKDDVMQQFLAGHDGSEGVLFIGRAQEKTRVFRTEKRRGADGVSYPWIVKTTAVINQWYFYCVDHDFGPFFVKFSSYFPYNGKLCINGNHWAQRQAARAGIGFTPLDNGFAAVDDPAALQRICDALGAEQINALLRKWLARLPHPFSPTDRVAGYRYDISILQAEFSLTQMPGRPVSGRIFFDQVLRDNLDIGRPDQVSLVFDRHLVRTGRRPTPGRFRTRVITDGVTPSLHVDYKNAKIKQYHKLGRALRTETTINDTWDFRIGKRLTNLPALRQIGFTANRRLLAVQKLSHNPIDGAAALAAVTAPVITDAGARVPGLRFTDPRAHALLAVLCVFRLLPHGFTNADLRHHLAPLPGKPPAHMTSSQISYDLRRLRVHGLIERIPHTFRYQVTDTGLRSARFLTRVHDQILRTGMADLTSPGPPVPTPLRTADRAYQAAIDDLAQQAGIAA